MKEKWSGQITVFLSLILICVCGLICGLLESVRTAGAQHFLRTAVYSSMDSLFSQYHRELWKNYRILGLEHFSEEAITREFAGFLQPYLDQENWYPFSVENCRINDRKVLTDDSGKYFEQEILDYMRYGIWTKEWGEEDALESLDGFTEAEQVSELTRSMEVQTKDAWKLERALEAISECFQEQEECRQKAEIRLRQEDGRGFCREADRLIKQLKKVPGLVDKYEKQADALGESLKTLRADYEASRTEMSESVQQSFEAELLEYQAYTDKDGERRRQIAGLSGLAGERITFVEEVQQEAREVEEFIDDWEPDDEDDELNTAALWAPVQRHFSRYQNLSLPFAAGVKDKEKEGLLKKLREMAGRGVLSLVLPEDAKISKGMLAAEQYPSHVISFEEQGLGILDKAMTAEYCQVFFRHFCDKEAAAEDGKEAVYELEYLLSGQDLDETNFIRTVERLLAVREGLNFIHILNDSEKRREAKALASAVVGASGILPLVSITAFLIMGVWAFGEAVADVRLLLRGGKVPLLKKKEDWKLSLDGLMDFAGKGKLDELGGKESGLTYEQYLTIFLFTVPGTLLLYRMMDVMEMNISRKQPGFRMEDCAYRVDMQTEVCGKHVYFSLGLWKSLIGKQETGYPLTMNASRAY